MLWGEKETGKDFEMSEGIFLFLRNVLSFPLDSGQQMPKGLVLMVSSYVLGRCLLLLEHLLTNIEKPQLTDRCPDLI